MRYLVLYIILSAVLIRCSGPAAKNTGGFRVEDMTGRKVLIPENVSKIIGLRAGALRLLIYCGAADLIAGIEEPEKRDERLYLEAFPELKKLPVIGPAMGGDAELILKTNPDVIFLSYTTKADADALQKKTGIPVVAIECPEFATEKERLFASFRLIGKIINKQGHVDTLIAYINNSIRELNDRTNDIPETEKPLVYIGGVSYSGSYGINSTQPFYPPFIFTNSKNAAASIDKDLISHVKGTFIDKEQLLRWNPDFLFIDYSGLSLAKSDLAPGSPLHESLDAVRNSNIYTLYPYNNYAINYEMVLVNAWYVSKVLYPGQFSEVNITAKTQEILKAFYGKTSKSILPEHNYKQFGKTNL